MQALGLSMQRLGATFLNAMPAPFHFLMLLTSESLLASLLVICCPLT